MLRRRQLLYLIVATTAVLSLYLYTFSVSKISAGPISLNAQKSNRIKVSSDGQSNDISLDLYFDLKQSEVDIEVNGHNIEFNKKTKIRNPQQTNIHLIFHSHVDPGWLQTFEGYYQSSTKNILNSVVDALLKYPQLRFIWSETSFMERWWRDASDTQKSQIKKFVAEGQLEISGGAWVMTDEATPLYYSAVENLIEGHRFIQSVFNITPKTSWSVDPFGHGAMMPYILTLAGVEDMVIGRFHDHIKQHLRDHQSLRWQWKPFYSSLEGPRVHSLPYMVYTTQDACPENNVCGCFHVGPSNRFHNCRNKMMTEMNKENVHEFATHFLEQIHRVQKLYGSENILVAVGDDFFFAKPDDFNQMVSGFTMLSEYINSNKDLKASMRFSTVSDFFGAISNETLPTLRGDFFPYTSDMAKPYPWWTGYFVHRPHSKTMERRLQNCLRTLDIASSLTKKTGDLTKVQNAKRDLLLFQHHDGITGTSVIEVMNDYEQRMLNSFKSFESEFSSNIYQTDSSQMVYNYSEGTLNEIKIDGAKKLAVFSSQTFSQNSLITIASKTKLKVALNEEEISVQNQNVDGGLIHSTFSATLSPLTATVFDISPSENVKEAKEIVQCFQFNSDGLIKGLILNDAFHPINITFWTILDRGGAYVIDFMKFDMRKVEYDKHNDSEGGVMYQRSYTFKGSQMTAEFSCFDDGEFDINVHSDLPDGSLLLMRIETNIKNRQFNTDINGIYHVPRTFKKKFEHSDNKSSILPYEANIFPVAASTFIEDGEKRMTVVIGQPTGSTSSNPGQLDILMDRRVSSDDGKGVGFGLSMDRRRSHIRYRVILEKHSSTLGEVSAAQGLKTTRAMDNLLYPPVAIVLDKAPLFEKFPFEWPCSVQIVSWRYLDSNSQLLVLRRVVYDISLSPDIECSNSLDDLFAHFSTNFDFRHSSLSTTKIGDKVTKSSLLSSLQDPFSISTFVLKTL